MFEDKKTPAPTHQPPTTEKKHPVPPSSEDVIDNVSARCRFSCIGNQVFYNGHEITDTSAKKQIHAEITAVLDKYIPHPRHENEQANPPAPHPKRTIKINRNTNQVFMNGKEIIDEPLKKQIIEDVHQTTEKCHTFALAQKNAEKQTEKLTEKQTETPSVQPLQTAQFAAQMAQSLAQTAESKTAESPTAAAPNNTQADHEKNPQTKILDDIFQNGRLSEEKQAALLNIAADIEKDRLTAPQSEKSFSEQLIDRAISSKNFNNTELSHILNTAVKYENEETSPSLRAETAVATENQAIENTPAQPDVRQEFPEEKFTRFEELNLSPEIKQALDIQHKDGKFSLKIPTDEKSKAEVINILRKMQTDERTNPSLGHQTADASQLSAHLQNYLNQMQNR